MDKLDIYWSIYETVVDGQSFPELEDLVEKADDALYDRLPDEFDALAQSYWNHELRGFVFGFLYAAKLFT